MDWQHNGVKIVPAGDLDPNTPQSLGMTRAAAITHARTGASKLWAGVGATGVQCRWRRSRQPETPVERATLAVKLGAGPFTGP